MKISNRELILAIGTLSLVLFGVTYWVGSSQIEEQRTLSTDRVRLRRQIELHKRILAEQSNWSNQLNELQSQLPVYGRKISINVELPKEIKRIADRHGLNLPLTQPESENEIGSLRELSVRCEWQGTLDAIVHFLYDLHEQGLRFDVRQIDIKPVTKEEGQLRGSMIINCAYRRDAQIAEPIE